MAKGPKGEYRPTDPIKGGVTVMKIAFGELSEDEVREVRKIAKRELEKRERTKPQTKPARKHKE